jgi:hypothetical protein
MPKAKPDVQKENKKFPTQKDISKEKNKNIPAPIDEGNKTDPLPAYCPISSLFPPPY